MHARAPSIGLFIVLAASLMACAAKPTALVIEIRSTTLTVPDDIDVLQLRVVGADSGGMVDQTFSLSESWPQTATIRPGASNDEAVTLTVTGRKSAAGGAPTFVVRRVVESAFLPGETRVVAVDLEADCRDIECADGVDCLAGGCVGGTDAGLDSSVDTGVLDSAVDTGALDSAVDSGLDAGMDADTGPVCTVAADCDDGVACTADICTDGECFHTADDGLCAMGATCDPVLGCPARTCATDSECDDGDACNGAETCPAGTCEPGTVVECDDGIACTVGACDAATGDCSFTPMDDRCDDGVICNGAETCDAVMGCQPGTAMDCDDSDACTSDQCDDAARMCAYATRDGDGDGFGSASCSSVGGVSADDCNDSNPSVFPGAPEVCNGVDDNCNSACDEMFTCCRGEVGACMTACGTMGTRVCGLTCGWGVCSPPPETCNGVDDDCNGLADDIFACEQGTTEPCTTSCGSTGMRTCDASCGWGACVAPTEVCNGSDDDCDGAVDNGFSCAAGRTTDCMTSCGTTGTRTCDATCTLGGCVPPPEACNGIDDNCDGLVDETTECAPGLVQGCVTSCGTAGSKTCDATCTFGACTPPAEACNGLDDDCDGLIDETFTCIPGSTGGCTSSCGTSGTRTCSASCTWGACSPPVEACNGSDDDCDGACDETFTCCAGTGGTCMTSCGTTGSRTCSAACGWSACSPPAETCNGVDDDCNGTCDDGFACCAGGSGSCTTSCGSTGTRSCAAGCSWNTCVAPAETCNGADDDCNGLADDGFACALGATGSCMTSCGSTGTRTCQAGCTWASCAPPTEACNGVDDDCDGMIDEGCGACAACTGATTIASPGGRFTQVASDSLSTGTCGGSGTEAVSTFTLTATSNVFISTHGSSVDTVLYVRECACNGTEIACNDDADGRTTSRLQLTDLAPGTYNVFADTNSATSASISLDLFISPSAPEGDLCGRPEALSPATRTTIMGNTCSLSDSYDMTIETGCASGGGGNGPEHVYWFYLPTASTLTFDGCQPGTGYDTTVYIRNVCSEAGGAAQVACNDDGCGGSPTCTARYRSNLTTTLTPGLYYLFVDGWDSGTGSCPCGDFQFNLSGF